MTEAATATPTTAPTQASNATTAEPASAAAVTELVSPPDGAAAEGVDSAAEATKETPPDPAKVAAIERARAAAERLKASRREKTALLEQQRQAHYALQQRDQQMQQLLSERERLAAQAAQFDAIKADPLAFFEQAGVPASKLVEMQLREQTPEAKLEKLQRDYEAKLQAAIDKVQRDNEERQHQAAQQQQMEAARQGFLKRAADEATYPTLSKLAGVRPQTLIREALDIHAEAARQGYQYSDAEVLQHLEDTYSRIYSPPAPKPGQTQRVATATSEKQTGTGNQQGNAGTPQTITNAMSSSRATLPSNFDELDDRTQKRLMAEAFGRISGNAASSDD